MSKSECRPLVEPVVVTDVYVSGIAAIEELGPNARLTLYVDATIPEADNAQCRQVVVKIIIPTDALPGCIRQAIAFLAARAISYFRAPPDEAMRMIH